MPKLFQQDRGGLQGAEYIAGLATPPAQHWMRNYFKAEWGEDQGCNPSSFDVYALLHHTADGPYIAHFNL